MPFASRSQARLIAMKESQGLMPRGSYKHWKAATPSMKALPEHVKKASERDGHGIWKCDECGAVLRRCECSGSKHCRDNVYTETCPECREAHATKEAAHIDDLAAVYSKMKSQSSIISRGFQNSGQITKKSKQYTGLALPQPRVFKQHPGFDPSMANRILVNNPTSESKRLLKDSGIQHNPENLRAMNVEIGMHELSESRANQAGKQFYRHRSPTVILQEHNRLSTMTGPGSEDTRRAVSETRNLKSMLRVNDVDPEFARHVAEHEGGVSGLEGDTVRSVFPSYDHGYSPRLSRHAIKHMSRRIQEASNDPRYFNKHASDHSDAFASMVIAPYRDGWMSSTRPIDKRSKPGEIGLVGGKLDPGETAVAAVRREAREEGWIPQKINPKPIHIKSTEDGKKIVVFAAEGTKKIRGDYKEKYREIYPMVVSKTDLANSHENNAFLHLLNEKRHTAAIPVDKAKALYRSKGLGVLKHYAPTAIAAIKKM